MIITEKFKHSWNT